MKYGKRYTDVIKESKKRAHRIVKTAGRLYFAYKVCKF
jgi:hypothetical protein